jgi:hypothetical protein
LNVIYIHIIKNAIKNITEIYKRIKVCLARIEQNILACCKSCSIINY